MATLDEALRSAKELLTRIEIISGDSVVNHIAKKGIADINDALELSTVELGEMESFLDYKAAYKLCMERAAQVDVLGIADVVKLIKWISDDESGKAAESFKEGPERQIAYAVEDAMRRVKEK